MTPIHPWLHLRGGREREAGAADLVPLWLVSAVGGELCCENRKENRQTRLQREHVGKIFRTVYVSHSETLLSITRSSPVMNLEVLCVLEQSFININR